MTVKVTIDLPRDVEEKLRRETPDLDADIREAYALELFRRGRVSHYELSCVLGLDRPATDAWLKRHKVFDGSLTMADLDDDRRTLDRAMRESR